MGQGTHEIKDAKCVAETEKAINVVAPDFESAMWIPKSQVHDDSEVYAEGHEGLLVVTQWFAEQRGWV